MFEDRDNNFKIKVFSGYLANESLIIFGKITFTFETIFPDILSNMELLQRFASFIGLITVHGVTA